MLVRLNGFEASVLGFISRYPDAPEIAAMLPKMSDDGREIALKMLEKAGVETPRTLE